jgi:hypothetical protein
VNFDLDRRAGRKALARSIAARRRETMALASRCSKGMHQEEAVSLAGEILVRV